MGTVHIPTLLEGLLEATAAEAAAKASITTYRASLEAEARRRLQVEGAAPTWKAAKLGTVRLDEATDWTATVADEPTFASYVAEHHPTEATATIHVNASDLPDALQALEFVQVPVLESALQVRPAWLPTFLKGLAVDVTEDRDASAQVTRTVVAADTSTGNVVPGIGATRSEAKLVVSLDRDRRTAAIAEARTQATALVEAASDPTDTPDVDATALDHRRRELEGMHGDQLATIARATGLGTSGTKAALAERIARTELATGHTIRPASALPVGPVGLRDREQEEAEQLARMAASPLPEGTEVEEVTTLPATEPEAPVIDQPVEEVPDGGDVLDHITEGLERPDAQDEALVADDSRRAHLLGLSREVLRQYAKATGINPGGTKGDLIDRLIDAGTSVLDVNDHARKARA